MNNSNLVLTAWSYGLVGLAYSLFALRLFQLGFLRAPRTEASVAVYAAVALSALWGWFGLGFHLQSDPTALSLSALSDLLRYGAWFVFLLTLFRSNVGKLPASMSYFMPVVVVLMLAGLVAQILARFQIGVLGDPSRWTLLCSMSLPVVALVLLEQVYRNVQEDSRWNAKPLCLGLLGVFAFDLYLYSEAVLFNRLDVDALGIRGAVHALMVPLLLLSITMRPKILSLSPSRWSIRNM